MMAHARPSLRHDLPSLLEHIAEVCPLPAAAQRVLALCSMEEAAIPEVAEALSCDPAMTAQVLRVANSAIYARPRTVTTLQQAVMTLGLMELRNIAAAMSLLAAFRSREELSLELHECGALAGAIARMLAVEFMPSLAGLTLVCGLLSDVGALACLAVDGPGYTALWKRAQAGGAVWTEDGAAARARLERERYGATTRAIGGALLRRNQLPLDIVQAVESPAENGEPPTLLGCMTAFARRAAPLLVATLDASGAGAIEDALTELAVQTELGQFDRERLRTICVKAAKHAETSLRREGVSLRRR